MQYTANRWWPRSGQHFINPLRSEQLACHAVSKQLVPIFTLKLFTFAKPLGFDRSQPNITFGGVGNAAGHMMGVVVTKDPQSLVQSWSWSTSAPLAIFSSTHKKFRCETCLDRALAWALFAQCIGLHISSRQDRLRTHGSRL